MSGGAAGGGARARRRQIAGPGAGPGRPARTRGRGEGGDLRSLPRALCTQSSLAAEGLPHRVRSAVAPQVRGLSPTPGRPPSVDAGDRVLSVRPPGLRSVAARLAHRAGGNLGSAVALGREPRPGGGAALSPRVTLPRPGPRGSGRSA